MTARPDVSGNLIGMELEFQHVSRLALSGINWLRYDVHDDGSIRGDTWKVGDFAIMPHRRRDGSLVLSFGMMKAEKIGLELTTHPYPYAEMCDVSQRLAELFAPVHQTPRTSIHVHWDVANKPWRYVKQVIKWFYYLEAPIFRMSCGGMKHRGERVYHGENTDHMYARPLSAPIAVHWGGKIAPLVRIARLLEAETASQMAATWGRLDTFWNADEPLGHYCPHRLHALNLVSVLRQGTLEWRLFDGIYSKLHHIVQLVGAVHRLALTDLEPALPPMKLGATPDIDPAYFSDLLGFDVMPLWGKAWPKPVSDERRLSHYQRMDVNTITSRSVRTIRNNAGEYDDGTDSFVLYRR